MCGFAPSVRHTGLQQTDRLQRLGGGREGKMSGITLLSVSLSLCLLCATGGTARSGSVILRDALERGPVSLNDMFREVEELMEDTQHILEEAVDQVCVTFYSFIQRQSCIVYLQQIEWHKFQLCHLSSILSYKFVSITLDKNQCHIGDNKFN